MNRLIIKNNKTKATLSFLSFFSALQDKKMHQLSTKHAAMHNLIHYSEGAFSTS